MWSPSSVETRGSCKYSLMSLVYSSSIFWGAAAAAAGAGLEPFLVWANAGAVAKARANSALAAIVKPSFIDGVLSGDLMSDIAFLGPVSTPGGECLKAGSKIFELNLPCFQPLPPLACPLRTCPHAIFELDKELALVASFQVHFLRRKRCFSGGTDTSRRLLRPCGTDPGC